MCVCSWSSPAFSLLCVSKTHRYASLHVRLCVRFILWGVEVCVSVYGLGQSIQTCFQTQASSQITVLWVCQVWTSCEKQHFLPALNALGKQSRKSSMLWPTGSPEQETLTAVISRSYQCVQAGDTTEMRFVQRRTTGTNHNVFMKLVSKAENFWFFANFQCYVFPKSLSLKSIWKQIGCLVSITKLIKVAFFKK